MVTGGLLEFPPFRLDLRAGRLWRDDQPVDLRPKAWTLLRYLAERPGALVTKEELHAAAWGDTVVSDDTLTQTLGELRRVLGDDPRSPQVIETVHRRGVRFIARVREVSTGDRRGAPDGRPNPLPGPHRPGTLVGRDTDLARLRALFARAAAGERQVVFILGEPGIGKTSVLEAFLDGLRASPQGVQVGHGQCVEQYGEQEPYMPVLEILDRLGQGPGRDRLLPILRAVAPGWLAQLPALHRPADSHRRRRDGDTTSHRMLREFASLVEGVAADRPLVLALDDLHWSDRGTVNLLSVLAQRPETARVMVVATYRPAEASVRDHPLAQVVANLRAHRRCQELALEYLSRADVAAYLVRRFLGSPVDGEVGAVVHAHTDGNPLFVVRLVDHLLARGWLIEKAGCWRLAVPRAIIERDVPDDLQRLIEGQLRLLSGPEREVLEAASAAGLLFEAPVVSAGMGRAVDEVETLCDDLARRQSWLERRGGVEWPDGTPAARYAFGHALYQRVLYDLLAPSRRAFLHQRIGERLEAGYAGQTAEVAGELAGHFQRSRDRGRVVTYLEQAARRAFDRLAYRDAVARLEPALVLLAELPEREDRARRELRLRQLYTVALSQTSGYVSEALLQNLTRARSLGQELQDPVALFDILCALCLLYSNAGDIDRAGEVGEELERLAARLEPSAELEAAFLRGAVVLWAGQLDAAEPFLARALASPARPEEADRPYGANPAVAARSFEALRRWLRGDPAGARALQGEAVTLARALGRPFTIAQAAVLDSYRLVLDGEWAEALRVASGAVDLAGEYGFPLWHGSGLVSRGRALVELGSVEAGMAELRQGLDLLGRSGLKLAIPLWQSFLAAACLRADRVDEGLAATEVGLAHCRASRARLFEPELWRLRGELLQRGAGAAPDRSAARQAVECLRTAREVARAHGATMLERRIAERPGTVSRSRRPSR